MIYLAQGLTVSFASDLVGIVMRFCSTRVLVIVAGLIYKHKKDLARAIIALATGVLTMVIVMIPLNLIFTTLYLQIFFGLPQDLALNSVKEVMWLGIIPMNLIKAGINAILTFLLYKRLGRLIRLEKFQGDPR